MRRMYSEQELTKIIGEVFDAKIEAGAFDDSISDAVDAYLVEHPVDITALEDKTIAPAVVNATTSVGAPSGAFTALSGGAITGDSIIENMSGYSFTKMADTENITFDYIYAGVVKNGNKLTMVIAVNVKKISASTANMEFVIGTFTLPNDVMNKIYPTTVGGATYIVDEKGIKGISQASYKITKDVLGFTEKVYGKIYMSAYIENMAQDDELYVRYEVTLLLSDNLAA